jgi:hypothetical protein
VPTASSSPGIFFYPRITITGTVGQDNTIVEATCEIAHGFIPGTLITVSGSNQSSHNGNFRVYDVNMGGDTTKFLYGHTDPAGSLVGTAATVVGTAPQLGTKLVGGANTNLSKNSNDVMVTAASAVGDISAVVAGGGLAGGATSGSATLTLHIDALSTIAPVAGDFLAFNDIDDGVTKKNTVVEVVAAGATGLPNSIFANTAGYMAATNDVNAKWNDGTSEMANMEKDVGNLITFWNYLAGDTATRDSMSSGVFTASVTTAGTYLVTAKVQFHAEDNDGIPETDAAFYSLSLSSYVNASGGAPASGTSVDIANTVKYTAWIGETLETTFTVNIPAADTFGIYSRITIAGAGASGTKYSHQAGAANGSSLAMIKIGPAT